MPRKPKTSIEFENSYFKWKNQPSITRKEKGKRRIWIRFRKTPDKSKNWTVEKRLTGEYKNEYRSTRYWSTDKWKIKRMLNIRKKRR